MKSIVCAVAGIAFGLLAGSAAVWFLHLTPERERAESVKAELSDLESRTSKAKERIEEAEAAFKDRVDRIQVLAERYKDDAEALRVLYEVAGDLPATIDFASIGANLASAKDQLSDSE